jgi:hypothetical protein
VSRKFFQEAYRHLGEEMVSAKRNCFVMLPAQAGIR